MGFLPWQSLCGAAIDECRAPATSNAWASSLDLRAGNNTLASTMVEGIPPALR
jgi:hypothetical protein